MPMMPIRVRRRTDVDECVLKQVSCVFYLLRKGGRVEHLVPVRWVPLLVRILVLFVLIFVAAFVAGTGVLDEIFLTLMEEALRFFVVVRRRSVRASLWGGDVPLRATFLAFACFGN